MSICIYYLCLFYIIMGNCMWTTTAYFAVTDYYDETTDGTTDEYVYETEDVTTEPDDTTVDSMSTYELGTTESVDSSSSTNELTTFVEALSTSFSTSDETSTAITSTAPVFTDCCHLMFLIDHSESIHKDTEWPLIINFVYNITNHLDIGMDKSKISVTRFASEADTQFCFNEYTEKADLLNAIENLPYDPPGATAIGTGLNYIKENVTSSSCGFTGAKGALVLITDGGNNLGPDPLPIAKSLRNKQNITIYAVGIKTTDSDVDALIQITGDKSRVFNGTYRDLDMFAEQISKVTCPPKADACKSGLIDLVYLVDESESVTEDAFNEEVKPFLISVTTEIAKTHSIGMDGVRVAMAWFSSSCGLEFNFDQVDSLEDFKMKVESAGYNPGATNTIGGFEIVRDNVFRTTELERLQSTRLLVVITDGKPNQPSKNLSDPSSVAKDLRDKYGAIILTVGVKEEQKTALIDWTGGNEDQFFNVSNFSELDDTFANFISKIISAKTKVCSGIVCKRTPFNLAYLVDESESVLDHFTAVKSFMQSVTNNVSSLTDDQSQFAMVWFSQATKNHNASGVEFDWTVGNEATNKKINGADIHIGATNVYEGLEMVRNNIFSTQNSKLDPDYINVLVFISDGAPNLPKNKTEQAITSANNLRKQNVTIISVGINDDGPGEEFLKGVAGSLDRVFIVQSDKTLVQFADKLTNSLPNPCNQTSPSDPSNTSTREEISLSPTAPSPGSTAITQGISLADSWKCNVAYPASTTNWVVSWPKFDEIDVVILIYPSNLISSQFYYIITTIIYWTHSVFAIAPEKVHVAVSTMSADIGGKWTLNSTNSSIGLSFNRSLHNLVRNDVTERNISELNCGLMWVQTLNPRSNFSKVIILWAHQPMSTEDRDDSLALAEELRNDGFIILCLLLNSGKTEVRDLGQICGDVKNIFKIDSELIKTKDTLDNTSQFLINRICLLQ